MQDIKVPEVTVEALQKLQAETEQIQKDILQKQATLNARVNYMRGIIAQVAISHGIDPDKHSLGIEEGMLVVKALPSSNGSEEIPA